MNVLSTSAFCYFWTAVGRLSAVSLWVEVCGRQCGAAIIRLCFLAVAACGPSMQLTGMPECRWIRYVSYYSAGFCFIFGKDSRLSHPKCMIRNHYLWGKTVREANSSHQERMPWETKYGGPNSQTTKGRRLLTEWQWVDLSHRFPTVRKRLNSFHNMECEQSLCPNTDLICSCLSRAICGE